MRMVEGVVCADTGRDVSGLFNAMAERYGFDPAWLVGGAIAESGLRERAARNGVWPDVSYGLFQTAVKWLPADALPGLQRSDGRTADDTPANRSAAFSWATDAANQTPYAARVFAANLARAGGDPQRAWELWNAPSLDWDSPLDAQHAANRRNYQRSLAEAERYVSDGPGAVPAWEPVDYRNRLPRFPEYGAYSPRPLSAVVGVTVHYTAGPASQTPEAIAAYQTSWAAAGQTGTGMPFPAIAYHALATADGQVYLCNGLDARVWHSGAAGRNDTRVGLCFTGTGAPTAAQVAGMGRFLAWAERTLGRPLDVEGHRDAPYATQCPGPAWPGFKPALLAARDAARGGPGPEPVRDVTGGFQVGEGFVAFLQAHPEAGIARSNERWLPDGTGTYIWLTVTPRYPKGAMLFWRKLRPDVVKLVSWDDD